MRADEPEALPVAVRWADPVRIAAPDLESAAAARERVRAAVADAGPDPDEVTVLPTDLGAPADQAVPLLAGSGLFRSRSGGSLRSRFGLPRPVNHFVRSTW